MPAERSRMGSGVATWALSEFKTPLTLTLSPAYGGEGKKPHVHSSPGGEARHQLLAIIDRSGAGVVGCRSWRSAAVTVYRPLIPSIKGAVAPRSETAMLKIRSRPAIPQVSG